MKEHPSGVCLQREPRVGAVDVHPHGEADEVEVYEVARGRLGPDLLARHPVLETDADRQAVPIEQLSHGRPLLTNGRIQPPGW